MFSMKRAKARRHTGPARPAPYLERSAGFAKAEFQTYLPRFFTLVSAPTLAHRPTVASRGSRPDENSRPAGEANEMQQLLRVLTAAVSDGRLSSTSPRQRPRSLQASRWQSRSSSTTSRSRGSSLRRKTCPRLPGEDAERTADKCPTQVQDELESYRQEARLRQSFEEYDDVAANISMVMAGIGPAEQGVHRAEGRHPEGDRGGQERQVDPREGEEADARRAGRGAEVGSADRQSGEHRAGQEVLLRQDRCGAAVAGPPPAGARGSPGTDGVPLRARASACELISPGAASANATLAHRGYRSVPRRLRWLRGRSGGDMEAPGRRTEKIRSGIVTNPHPDQAHVGRPRPATQARRVSCTRSRTASPTNQTTSEPALKDR